MFTVASVSMLVRFAPPEMRGRASGLWATGFLLGNLAGPLLGGGLVSVQPARAVPRLRGDAPGRDDPDRALLRGGRAGVGRRPGRRRRCRSSRFRAALGHPTYRAALAARSPTAGPCSGCASRSSRCSSSRPSTSAESWAGSRCRCSPRATRRRCVLAGRLADRRGRRPPMLVGLAISAAGTAVLGADPDSLPLFLVVSLVAGLGSGLVNPPLNAAVADVDRVERPGPGRCWPGFQMAGDIGTILGPLVAGAAARSPGSAGRSRHRRSALSRSGCGHRDVVGAWRRRRRGVDGTPEGPSTALVPVPPSAGATSPRV